MKKTGAKVLENRAIAKDVYLMKLEMDSSEISNSGQFINILLNDLFLRRPISISDWDDNSVDIIYKVVGEGTEKMRHYKEGDLFDDILISLGNGFEIEKDIQSPLIVGGGVGVPPLYRLCKDLIVAGKKPIVVLGFASKDDVFYHKEFADLVGENLHISTIDGSFGYKGLVTDIIDNELQGYDYIYSCGPMPMLRALDKYDVSGQFSFEERMGCGYGACMGCSKKTKNGSYKRVCKEGPVFRKEEIIW